MLQEELVHELPYRCFLRVGHEFAPFPAESEARCAARGFAQLRPDRYRRRDTLADLLALPLRHRGDHGVEEAASRRRGVDRLLERDEPRVVFAEDIRDVEELAGIPSEAGKLRKNECFDVARADVVEHPLRLRMLHDGLAAHAREVIDLPDVPAFRFGVVPGAGFVVLRALALRLILR